MDAGCASVATYLPMYTYIGLENVWLARAASLRWWGIGAFQDLLGWMEEFRQSRWFWFAVAAAIVTCCCSGTDGSDMKTPSFT
jgi:hypothetical protein